MFPTFATLGLLGAFLGLYKPKKAPQVFCKKSDVGGLSL
jgi:hypothetical protein